MNPGLIAFITAAVGVTLAEMGDKTQLLAMAFATRYKASKVLIGVFIATVLNHALAVAVGNYIAKFDAVKGWIEAVAALSFIFFGLWTVRGDKLEGEDEKKTRFGAVMTVAIAFFIAEIGDKTQLATIALAADFSGSPLAILMGTTTGMLIADGIGIIVGVVMCKRIPEKIVKLVSAAVFILFGFAGVLEASINRLGLSKELTAGIIVILALITGAIAYKLIKNMTETPQEVVNEFCRVKIKEPSSETK